jgi:hypothetical protein
MFLPKLKICGIVETNECLCLDRNTKHVCSGELGKGCIWRMRINVDLAMRVGGYMPR